MAKELLIEDNVIVNWTIVAICVGKCIYSRYFFSNKQVEANRESNYKGEFTIEKKEEPKEERKVKYSKLQEMSEHLVNLLKNHNTPSSAFNSLEELSRHLQVFVNGNEYELLDKTLNNLNNYEKQLEKLEKEVSKPLEVNDLLGGVPENNVSKKQEINDVLYILRKNFILSRLVVTEDSDDDSSNYIENYDWFKTLKNNNQKILDIITGIYKIDDLDKAKRKEEIDKITNELNYEEKWLLFQNMLTNYINRENVEEEVEGEDNEKKEIGSSVSLLMPRRAKKYLDTNVANTKIADAFLNNLKASIAQNPKSISLIVDKVRITFPEIFKFLRDLGDLGVYFKTIEAHLLQAMVNTDDDNKEFESFKILGTLIRLRRLQEN